MVMGTGVLIKNSIGAGAVIILVLISAIPPAEAGNSLPVLSGGGSTSAAGL